MLFIAPLRCLTISRPYQPKPQHNHKFVLTEATTKTMKNGIISVSTNAILPPKIPTIPQDCPIHAASDVSNIVVVAIHALVLGCHTINSLLLICPSRPKDFRTVCQVHPKSQAPLQYICIFSSVFMDPDRIVGGVE